MLTNAQIGPAQQWLADSKIIVSNTVLSGGILDAITALDDLLTGKHRGNLIVRLTNRG